MESEFGNSPPTWCHVGYSARNLQKIAPWSARREVLKPSSVPRTSSALPTILCRSPEVGDEAFRQSYEDTAAICAVSGNVSLPDGVIDRQYIPCLDSALANVSALYLFDAAQHDWHTASGV